MTFGKIALLGAILAVSAPFALADSISFTGTEAGNGITATGFSLGNKITAAGDPHVNDSKGTLGSTETGVFSSFTSGTAVYFPLAQIGGNPAFKYSTLNTTTPTLFMTVTENGKTLDVYLTGETSATVGTGTTVGVLNLVGYILLDGTVGETPITIKITNSSKGTNASAFTATLTTTQAPVLPPVATAPEPASLMLLGTGVLGIAGTVRRRRKKA